MTDYELLTNTFRQLGICYIDERKIDYKGRVYHCIYHVSFKKSLFKTISDLRSKNFDYMTHYSFFEFDHNGTLESY